MATRVRKIIPQFQAAYGILLVGIDTTRYIFTYPWRDSLFGMSQTFKDPDRYLDQWIRARQSEYSFIGLVASVVSAVVAQMLQLQQLQESPWPALAASYLALLLSLMAIVTALHHTIFLNSILFQPSRDAQLWRVFGLPTSLDEPPTEWHGAYQPSIWLRAVLFNIPQLLLSFSIICNFIVVGLISIYPIWYREGGSWDKPQKVACAGIAGLVLGTVAYFGGVFCQYTKKG